MLLDRRRSCSSRLTSQLTEQRDCFRKFGGSFRADRLPGLGCYTLAWTAINSSQQCVSGEKSALARAVVFLCSHVISVRLTCAMLTSLFSWMNSGVFDVSCNINGNFPQFQNWVCQSRPQSTLCKIEETRPLLSPRAAAFTSIWHIQFYTWRPSWVSCGQILKRLNE